MITLSINEQIKIKIKQKRENRYEWDGRRFWKWKMHGHLEFLTKGKKRMRNNIGGGWQWKWHQNGSKSTWSPHHPLLLLPHFKFGVIIAWHQYCVDLLHLHLSLSWISQTSPFSSLSFLYSFCFSIQGWGAT